MYLYWRSHELAHREGCTYFTGIHILAELALNQVHKFMDMLI